MSLLLVIKANNLNSDPETTYKAVKIINEHGSRRGPRGLPIFLPGINILFGLIDETKHTFEENIRWLKRFVDEDLMIRRINIRKVVPFEGTDLARKAGTKFLKKNGKYHWRWRNSIRQEVDLPMLKKVAPLGTIINDVRMEIHDGNTTFGRQIGTYPLIIGIRQKLELKKTYDIKVTGHMLRSITGEVVQEHGS